MNQAEIADQLHEVVLQVLTGWKLAGVRFASIVDDNPTAWPADLTEADVRTRAHGMGLEVLELDDKASLVKLGEALMWSVTRQVDSDLAEQLARDAGEA